MSMTNGEIIHNYLEESLEGDSIKHSLCRTLENSNLQME
jgi:hypothetical protein